MSHASHMLPGELVVRSGSFELFLDFAQVPR